jgi:hypothetical protein
MMLDTLSIDVNICPTMIKVSYSLLKLKECT